MRKMPSQENTAMNPVRPFKRALDTKFGDISFIYFVKSKLIFGGLTG